ncbi:SOS response-associated peptidase [Fusibacter bizertensis]
MCGRFYLEADVEFLLKYFKIKYKPNFKIPETVIFPTQDAPIIIQSKGERRIGMMQWGFILPGTSKLIINSRAETISTKPLFKEAFEKRRCIILASGFFEWSEFTEEKKKPQYTVELPSQSMMCIAGIYTNIKDGNGENSWRFSIVTREANAAMKSIHPRMPLILAESDIDIWLNPESDKETLAMLLKYDVGDLSLKLTNPNPLGFHQLTIDT